MRGPLLLTLAIARTIRDPVDQKALSERDICTKYITPAIVKGGWDAQVQVKRIVVKVEHLMKLCDNLEAKRQRAEDRASKLAEAAVQEMAT